MKYTKWAPIDCLVVSIMELAQMCLSRQDASSVAETFPHSSGSAVCDSSYYFDIIPAFTAL